MGRCDEQLSDLFLFLVTVSPSNAFSLTVVCLSPQLSVRSNDNSHRKAYSNGRCEVSRVARRVEAELFAVLLMMNFLF